jgi:hypothetical protein
MRRCDDATWVGVERALAVCSLRRVAGQGWPGRCHPGTATPGPREAHGSRLLGHLLGQPQPTTPQQVAQPRQRRLQIVTGGADRRHAHPAAGPQRPPHPGQPGLKDAIGDEHLGHIGQVERLAVLQLFDALLAQLDPVGQLRRGHVAARLGQWGRGRLQADHPQGRKGAAQLDGDHPDPHPHVQEAG